MALTPVSNAASPGSLRIDAVDYDHPDAARLIEEVQQEYVVRYGGRDSSPVDPAEFAPPGGLFLVCYLGGTTVACGGWRAPGPDAGPGAEIKRMYVTPAARGRGLARRMLAQLERSARGAGYHRVILETGSRQPEAVELYRSSGYTEIPGYGYYAGSPHSLHFAKLLGGTGECNGRAGSLWLSRCEFRPSRSVTAEPAGDDCAGARTRTRVPSAAAVPGLPRRPAYDGAMAGKRRV